MTELAPADATRERMLQVIGLSVLLPGLGHLAAGARKVGLIWLLTANAALVLGFQLAGFTQFDFGFAWNLFGLKLIVTLPESLNFGGTVLLAQLFQSVETGGKFVEHLPLRQVGYLMSAVAGILSVASASHAAGCVLQKMQPSRHAKVHPGQAALLALLFPGLGHWVIGRRFKAKLLGGSLLLMFVLGLALGGFADFDRQRHAYYWIGQMFNGLPAWLSYLPLLPLRMGAVYPFQDTGFTFTSVAGMFNIVVALDAYHRAQSDWLSADKVQSTEEGASEEVAS